MSLFIVNARLWPCDQTCAGRNGAPAGREDQMPTFTGLSGCGMRILAGIDRASLAHARPNLCVIAKPPEFGAQGLYPIDVVLAWASVSPRDLPPRSRVIEGNRELTQRQRSGKNWVAQSDVVQSVGDWAIRTPPYVANPIRRACQCDYVARAQRRFRRARMWSRAMWRRRPESPTTEPAPPQLP
jgi:hypothetical protein